MYGFFDNAIFLIIISSTIYFFKQTMWWIEWLHKESYERPEAELRLDEQVHTPNYKTINNFQFDANAVYCHVIKREQKTNEPWFQESLQWIVELKKVDGKVIASFLKFWATSWKKQNKEEWRSIDPRGIPDNLRLLVQEKSKEIDTIPGNPDQATTIDLFSDQETLVWDTKKELWILYNEVNNDIPNN